MKTADKTYQGYIALILWSTAAAFIRSLSELIGPFTAAFYVYLLGGLLTLIFSPRQGEQGALARQLDRSTILCGIMYILYVFATFYSIGISQTRVMSLGVTVIKSLWPLFTLILSIPILHEKKKVSTWGLLFSLAGILVVVLGSSNGEALTPATFRIVDLFPFFIGLVSAVSWALYSNLLKKRTIDGKIIGLFMLISGLTMGLISLFVAEPSNWSLNVVLQIIYRGVVTIFIANALWNQSVIKGDIQKVSIAANYLPIMSALTSALILNVKLDFSLLIGGALIVIGNIFHRK
ncbi:MAG: EamA family transporter [Chloroflexi bacterium]|jgi:drug/metabolite transporter (DMT)-like permease|nr:EamA family transporter [Chloroflexota bacterium]